ncbi:hypothetical protein CHUAL_014205 [Chamberlinius hualienensis]
MALYNVHSIPILIKYRARVCSKATLFYLICVAFTFIIPLLIAFRSEGFWKRTDWYSEQPKIRFKKQLLIWIELDDGIDYLAWSSFENLNKLLDSHLRIPLIQSREDDWNRDGVNDKMDLILDFPLTTETVKSATLLLLFDYQLNTFCRLQMESLAYFQQIAATNGLEWRIIADLSLKQKAPLPHTGLFSTYNVSIFDADSIFAESFEIDRILEKYSERNVSTTVSGVYSIWKGGRGYNQPFTIRLTLKYPHELILYPFICYCHCCTVYDDFRILKLK